MNPALPNAKEINVHDSLDEQWAEKNFLGKDLEKAKQLFRENPLHYLDDLMWMGPKAFCRFLPAAIDYLICPDSIGDADAVNSFLDILEFRLKHDGPAIAPSKPNIRAAILAILERWECYDCNPEIYGDLPARYRTLLPKLNA